jgi:hypothetical protein
MKEPIRDKSFPPIRPLPYAVLRNIPVFVASNQSFVARSKTLVAFNQTSVTRNEALVASREDFGGAKNAARL